MSVKTKCSMDYTLHVSCFNWGNFTFAEIGAGISYVISSASVDPCSGAPIPPPEPPEVSGAASLSGLSFHVVAHIGPAAKDYYSSAQCADPNYNWEYYNSWTKVLAAAPHGLAYGVYNGSGCPCRIISQHANTLGSNWWNSGFDVYQNGVFLAGCHTSGDFVQGKCQTDFRLMGTGGADHAIVIGNPFGSTYLVNFTGPTTPGYDRGGGGLVGFSATISNISEDDYSGP